MERNPEADHLDPILQEMNLVSMDPSNERMAPEIEQQNTKEYAAKIVLEASLPDTETIPTTLVSGSQKGFISPEILYQIIDCLDRSDDLPTIICVSLTAKVSYDYLAFLGRQGGLVQDGRITSWDMTWNLSLDQRLELAPPLKNWVGGNYQVATPNAIAAYV
ncbi:hypothetical protein BTUL_0062g00340 [Botrytis tulipae]|uniref:Uncharacterized protein n=1 Tax=Botrytis tulipae TaxID=87230 RepID=A0A4Z1EQP8_9HELO|nr:hypothetical protein BTUL_0062g00340 [Botrytis tulipae]